VRPLSLCRSRARANGQDASDDQRCAAGSGPFCQRIALHHSLVGFVLAETKPRPTRSPAFCNGLWGIKERGRPSAELRYWTCPSAADEADPPAWALRITGIGRASRRTGGRCSDACY
jgi:hypothetical protein